MGVKKYNNNAFSTLAAAITTSSQTSITLQTGHGNRFPVVNQGGSGTDSALVTLQNSAGTIEIVNVARRDTGVDVLTIGVPGTATASASGRGLESTTATTWAIGDVVEQRITAGELTEFLITGGALGTPASGTATNLTGLPVSTGISGLGTSVATALAASVGTTGSFLTTSDCTAYYLPSTSDGWRGLLRAGFDHWNRNQQWGGPWGGQMVDAATGTLRDVEFITGNIGANGLQGWSFGDAAARTREACGFKIPETATVAAIWVRLSKIGNPANNAVLSILPDDGTGTKPTGSTAIANGTATALSGKLFSSVGQYYRFVFATPPTLTGGTQYHFALTSSGAVDASNYWTFDVTNSKAYPFGNASYADATPTWAATTTVAFCFGVELSDTGKVLQTSGTFDGKLAFGGSGASGVLSMSRGLNTSVPLQEMYGDMTEFTAYRVITACTKGTTIFDTGYGENHDRVVFRCNVTTGYGSINVYEQDGTLVTVTASATDLSSGTHSVGWYVRAKNDGSDRIDLYIDGTTYSSTSLSLSFDKALPLLGCEYVGGGFALAPTYSGSSIGINGFSGLPSTLGWTFGGSATEANMWSVSGGKLYQNKSGDTGSQDGYYAKAWAASNANGYNVAVKLRVRSSDNLLGTIASVAVVPSDGTRRQYTYFGEYYVRINGATFFYVQADFKSADTVLHLVAKGTDGFMFANRKLVVDGSGNAGATANNSLDVGDYSAGAGAYSDSTHSYWNYYTTAWSPPEFTTGSVSEYINWKGNQKALWPLLYNSGTQVSGKALMGISTNYLDKSTRIAGIERRGITYNDSTTSTAIPPIVTMSEMETYVMGESVELFGTYTGFNSGANNNYIGACFDGVTKPTETVLAYSPASTVMSVCGQSSTYLGLHRAAMAWSVNTGTGTADDAYRAVKIKGSV